MRFLNDRLLDKILFINKHHSGGDVPQKKDFIAQVMVCTSPGTLDRDYMFSNTDFTGKGMFAKLNADILEGDPLLIYSFGAYPWRYDVDTIYFKVEEGGFAFSVYAVGNNNETMSTALISNSKGYAVNDIDIIWTLDGIWVNGVKGVWDDATGFNQFCNTIKTEAIWHGYGPEYSSTAGIGYVVDYYTV